VDEPRAEGTRAAAAGGGPQTSKGTRLLLRAFQRLEAETPTWISNGISNLRRPSYRLLRLPIGILLAIGGLFSFLPVLGIWMLPLGLLLVALDVPALRTPVGKSTLWALNRWTNFRARMGW
jgi:hypothetical protein